MSTFTRPTQGFRAPARRQRYNTIRRETPYHARCEELETRTLLSFPQGVQSLSGRPAHIGIVIRHQLADGLFGSQVAELS